MNHQQRRAMRLPKVANTGAEAMSDGTPRDEIAPAGGASALAVGLAISLPWHIGFHNEIADRLRPNGDWHPDIVRYKVVQVCDHDGRHVAWAKSQEHAALIIEAVNKMANAEVRGCPPHKTEKE